MAVTFCLACKEVVDDTVTESSSTLDLHPWQQDLTFPFPLLQQGKRGDAWSQTAETLKRPEDHFLVLCLFYGILWRVPGTFTNSDQ